MPVCLFIHGFVFTERHGLVVYLAARMPDRGRVCVDRPFNGVSFIRGTKDDGYKTFDARESRALPPFVFVYLRGVRDPRDLYEKSMGKDRSRHQ
jgi:hypothetical protein